MRLKLYHAFLGPGDEKRAGMVIPRTDAENILVSYAYLGDLGKATEYFAHLREWGATSLMLDSGAFTVFNSGGTVDLAEYGRAIAALKPEVYVQLDVIGDADGTRANLERMRAAGLKPLPVFTRGAPFEHLIRLLDEGEDYICLGNIAKAETQVRLDWCRYVFHVTAKWMKKEGRSRPPRYHAFGVTEPTVLFAFPFYSCDSSSGLMQAVFGRVFTYDRIRRRLTSVNVNSKETGWKCPEGIDVGVTEDRTRPQAERAVANARALEQMAADITAMWDARGVSWDARPAVA